MVAGRSGDEGKGDRKDEPRRGTCRNEDVFRGIVFGVGFVAVVVVIWVEVGGAGDIPTEPETEVDAERETVLVAIEGPETGLSSAWVLEPDSNLGSGSGSGGSITAFPLSLM